MDATTRRKLKPKLRMYGKDGRGWRCVKATGEGVERWKWKGGVAAALVLVTADSELGVCSEIGPTLSLLST